MPDDPRQTLTGGRSRDALQAPRGQGLVSLAGDLALSPLRGLEDFGRDLVGLGDTLIPGLDIDTSGPRLVDRLFRDEEETTVGRLASGIFNFLAGFLPGIGLVGKFGKVGRIANLTFKGERAARIAGKVKTATAIQVGRGAAAGVLADFTAFDGNEERLSNLLTEFPLLDNFVTQFLAADEDDPELVGRGKQVLEGLGAGAFADLLFVGLRGLKAQRKVRADVDATPLEAAKAIEDTVPAKEVRETADRANDVRRGQADDPTKVDVERVERVDKLPATGSDRTADDLAGKPKPRRTVDDAKPPKPPKPPKKPEAAGAPEQPSRGSTPKADKAVLQVLSRTAAGRKRLLKERLQMTDDEVKLALADFDQRRQRGSQGILVDKNGNLAPDPFVNPRNLSAEQLAMLGIDPKGLNLSRTIADDDVGFLIRSYEGMFGPLPGDARLPVPNEETLRAALEDLGDIAGNVDPGDLLATLVEKSFDRADILRHGTRMGVGLRMMVVTHGEEILERLVQEGEGAPQIARFLDDLKNHALLAKYVREGDAEAGRGLQSLKITAQSLNDLDTITRIIGEAGGEEQARRLLDAVRLGMHDGGVEGAAHMARMASLSLGGRFLAATIEFFINSILSGAKTFSTNGLSPLLHSVHIPMENMVGGAITRQPAVTQRAFDQIIDLGTSFQESMRLGAKAFREGIYFLDPMRGVRDDPFSRVSAFDPRALGMDPDSASGHAMSFFSKFVNLPTRLLMATDETIKQMNYRTVAKSRLRQDGLEAGLKGPLLADHITQGMTKLTEQGQSYSIKVFRQRAEDLARSQGITDRLGREQFVAERMKDFSPRLSRIAEEGLRRANEGAFTTSLEPGTLAKGWQDLRNQHPYLILVTPFVRTPVNLVRAAIQRLPNPWGMTEAILNRNMPVGSPELGRLKTKFAREVLSGDPDRVASAVGRQAFGLSAMTFFTGLAGQGLITGRGPSDKEQRDLLTQAGWQPYSVRVGDKFFSYLRLDPWATMIGSVADIYDYARLAPSDEQENLGTGGMAIAMAFANNFTNKTYLQGLSQVVDALSDPEKKLQGVLQRYGSAAIPNGLAQAVELGGDDVMRDIHSFSERLRSRVPGFSDSVPPMRNLFGEPMRRPRGFALGLENVPGPVGDIMSMMSPIVYRDVQDDEVNSEFVRLKHGFSPPAATRFEVDLFGVRNSRGQSAYDRWLQLHGMVKVGGRTITNELKRLIRSQTYQGLSPISTSTATSPRVAAISSVISEYRDEAWETMLREFPSLSRDITTSSRRRRAFLAGQRGQGSSFNLLGVVPTTGNIGGR